MFFEACLLASTDDRRTLAAAQQPWDIAGSAHAEYTAFAPWVETNPPAPNMSTRK